MPRALRPRALVRMDELLEFCIPVEQEHPRTATRLYMIGLYGPLKDGWLWGGPYNNRRKLSTYEIETMMTATEREDLLASCAPVEHGKSSTLPPTPEQENEVIKGLPEAVKKPYCLTRPDIVKLVAECSTHPEPEPKEPEPDPRMEVISRYAAPWLAQMLGALAGGTETARAAAEEELVAYLAPPVRSFHRPALHSQLYSDAPALTVITEFSH